MEIGVLYILPISMFQWRSTVILVFGSKDAIVKLTLSLRKQYLRYEKSGTRTLVAI